MSCLVLLVALLCGSCTKQDERKPVFPVSGHLLYEGQPTPQALVIFHAVDDPNPPPAKPRGVIDKDGRFTVSTYVRGDGAPVGRYTVTVTWQKPLNRPGNVGEEAFGPNLLPPKYSDPKTTDLSAEVKEGVNELPPFHLKRQ
jgi:hypothetical protein